MKAVILAGGFGTRLSEETSIRPKPMIEIGERPILWHLMKYLSHYGIREFIICLGYKGYVIKEYFVNYFFHNSDLTCNLETNGIEIHRKTRENWIVTLVDTGQSTMTGGRLKKVEAYLDHEPFLFTYGDGLSDVDISSLTEFHNSHGRLATVTGILQPGRFGILDINGIQVKNFLEKPITENAWINGGYFILDPKVLDYIDGDDTIWEKEPLENLSRSGELYCYQHRGFWHPIDTLRDKNLAEKLWSSENSPWKLWDD